MFPYLYHQKQDLTVRSLVLHIHSIAFPLNYDVILRIHYFRFSLLTRLLDRRLRHRSNVSTTTAFLLLFLLGIRNATLSLPLQRYFLLSRLPSNLRSLLLPSFSSAFIYVPRRFDLSFNWLLLAYYFHDDTLTCGTGLFRPPFCIATLLRMHCSIQSIDNIKYCNNNTTRKLVPEYNKNLYQFDTSLVSQCDLFILGNFLSPNSVQPRARLGLLGQRLYRVHDDELTMRRD